jgi:hypothetical protein
LNQALVTLGLLAVDQGDEFTWATAQAVIGWQSALGIETTGEVRLGELVAVPVLPAALTLGEAVLPGGRLGGGEQVVFGGTGEVVFQVRSQGSDWAAIPGAGTIVVECGDKAWPAVVSASTTAPGSSSTQISTLSAPDGGIVCGDQCDALPAGAEVSLFGQVEIVPKTSGLAVPVAAVRTDASGLAYVVLANGDKAPVEVKAAAQGMAIVTGLELGQTILLDDDGRSGTGSSGLSSTEPADPGEGGESEVPGGEETPM